MSQGSNGAYTTTNLYDAQFREYEIYGRWPSPDPAGIAAANPANPQSWNRYAYVMNNPLALIDPLGLAAAGLNQAPNGCNPDDLDIVECVLQGPNCVGTTFMDITDILSPPPCLPTPGDPFFFMGGTGGGGNGPGDLCGGHDCFNPEPNNKTTTCMGPATVSAVGNGPDQAPYTGHTGSLYPPIPGGAMGTVAVQNNFLGIGRKGLRTYGTQINVSFADNGAIVASGGPAGPYTVGDRGDINIQNDPSVRFDLYRWDSTHDAFQFGIQHYTGTVTFPTASGGTCPAGWTTVQP